MSCSALQEVRQEHGEATDMQLSNKCTQLECCLFLQEQPNYGLSLLVC